MEALSRAAIEGNLDSLSQVLREDPLILDKILSGCFKANPLHLAISRNRVDFVKDLLRRTGGELAEVLDSGRSALHLAAARGNVEIVKAVLKARPEMCLSRDPNGRNPIHIAAMKGKVDALEELVRACLNAARVKLDQDETVLHLCVKHGQLEALQRLLEMNIGSEFVNARDGSGNTILHLAVSGKHFEILKHIVNYDNLEVSIRQKRKKLAVNVANAEGHTPLDIALLSQNKRFEDFLREAKCKQARDVVQRDWLSRKRDTLMVVASLIATMAFQAAVTPPGGVWQENSKTYRAGEAVMAYNYPDSFPYFLRANTIAFVASLSTILLLISDLPFKNRIYMWGLVVIMWLTITSTAFTYAFSITVVTPKKDRASLSNTIVVGVIVWCSVMALLLAVHTYGLIRDLWFDYQRRSMSSENIFKYGYGEGNQESNDEPTDEPMQPHMATRQGDINQPQDEVQIEMKQRD